MALLLHHPYGALTHLSRIPPPSRSLCHGSNLLRRGASGKPGEVQAGLLYKTVGYIQNTLIRSRSKTPNRIQEQETLLQFHQQILCVNLVASSNGNALDHTVGLRGDFHFYLHGFENNERFTRLHHVV